MNIYTKFIDYFKKNRLCKQKEANDLKEKQIACYEIEVEKETEKMGNTYCAITGKSCCTHECVHYQKGFVWYSMYFDVYQKESPRCKLWGN